MTHLEAFPECEIELSGGIDSRMILAAIPRSERPKHTAVTLSSAGSADTRIARKLAESNGMKHRIVDLDQAMDISAETMLNQLKHASYKHEHAGNPVDKLALEIVRTELGNTPRLSGQNGEIMRGFYYHGQPLTGVFEDRRHTRLLEWRLKGNDTVRQSMLKDEFRNNAEASVALKTAEILRPHASWPEALDRFYLGQRMQRWCGCSVSAAVGDRAILMPFFNRRFVDWAIGAPARAKQGSELACRLISAAAPELAEMPLDNGARPSRLGTTGPAKHLHTLGSVGGKVIRRIVRRASGRSRENTGTKPLTQLLLDHGVLSTLNWGALRASEIFDDAVLDGIEMGVIPMDRASLGFLIASSYTLDSLGSD